MGFNTTLVVLNDALGRIREDKTFGKSVADAVDHLAVLRRGQVVDIASGGHVNAATVIESHHADTYSAILVGGSCGRSLEVYVHSSSEDPELELLRKLAHKRGYALRRM